MNGSSSSALVLTADLGGWEGFEKIPIDFLNNLTQVLRALASYPRIFAWATVGFINYGNESVAQTLDAAIVDLC